MNNKGFTLVELLITIALIAMISLIIAPRVTTMIKKNKVDGCKSLFMSVENAAKNYVSDNRYNLQSSLTSSSGLNITSQDLINNGYIKNSLTNPINKTEIKFKVTVKYDKINKKYTYDVKTDGNKAVTDICK